MAAGRIAVLRPGSAGAAESFAAATATDGDLFANDGKTMLHLKNGSGAPITATVHAQHACNQGSTHDDVVTVPAGGERIIGPFSQEQFGTDTLVTCSAVTTVTVAAVRAS